MLTLELTHVPPNLQLLPGGLYTYLLRLKCLLHPCGGDLTASSYLINSSSGQSQSERSISSSLLIIVSHLNSSDGEYSFTPIRGEERYHGVSHETFIFEFSYLRLLVSVSLVPLCPCLQERLLLSLLPAHIARVMKAEIIQRLQGPNFGRTESTNNFHNLYVQRHTNVRYTLPFPPSPFNH